MTIETMTDPAEIVAARDHENNDARIWARLAEVAPPPEQYDLVILDRMNGPHLRFNGKLLMETQSKIRHGRWTEWRLWETQAGAWVTETVACTDLAAEDDFVRAVVIPIGETEYERRIAVMDVFEWRSHTRSALKKALGWMFTPVWVA